METTVIMRRGLFDSEVRQNSKTEFFCATDLVKLGNDYRRANKLAYFNLSVFLKLEGTKEFINSLEKQFGNPLTITRGRNGATWVHPYLFIDIALALSPTLKLDVYTWIYDYLIKYRNDSGDSYKKMSGALFNTYDNKEKFHKLIPKIALDIKEALNVDEWNTATEFQLERRDRIHENIALLADILPTHEAVRIGIIKGLTK